MVDIVSGNHAHDMLDRFLPALGMLAELLPLIGRKRFEKPKIRFAYHALQFDRLAGIALLVVSRDDPCVLIVGLEGRSRRSENGAHAPANYDLHIGEVSQDFRNRPFLGLRPLAKFGCGDAFDESS